MKMYIKNGEVFIAQADNLDKIEIRSDGEVSFLDASILSPHENLEAVAFDNIPDVIEGVKITNKS